MEEMEEMKRTMIDFADNLSRRYWSPMKIRKVEMGSPAINNKNWK